MTQTKISGHDNLMKIDGAFIVNNDDAGYQAAKVRRARELSIQETEQRINSLENKMDLILNILQQKV